MTKRLLASLMLIGLISLTGCAKTEAPVVEGEEASMEETMEEGEAMEEKDGEAMEEEAMEEAMEESSEEGEAMEEEKTEEAAA